MQQEESRYDRGLGTMKTIFGPGIESALKGLAETSPHLCLLVDFNDLGQRAALAIIVYLRGRLCSALGSSVPTLPNERFARSYKSRTDS